MTTTRPILLFAAGLALVATACGADTTATTTVAPTTRTASDVTNTVGEPTTTEAPPTTAATTVAATSTAPPSTTAAPGADHVVDVEIAAGAVTAPDRPEVAVGATVLLRVRSDVADEAHVHGYDYFLDLVPGTTAELEFVADIPGIFEIELEQAGTLLLELVVR